ncbi:MULTISPECIES: BON domain-containing protein [unclassified Acidocella]|uniref:BON domain-containing protein n=1 Tax=unclassified Acidocella TaxID=2648610 RepID=UPI00028D437F|nr:MULTISPECIES: BON domain-containing protein [unclassified Acidocella]EKM98110.1 hypothetical protein MXAZACID_17114 [Acidocella sp. MX-AZ02]WBO59432.1 BON domain-containing protein [Acidocella sp. MX-AZ03]
MSEGTIRQRVVAELEFEPRVNAAHIGVAVAGHVVTLTGYVDSYAERRAAELAARRVRGVHGIAQEIEVRLPSGKRLADDEIAGRAIKIIAWDSSLPEGQIQVRVRQGLVALTGRVSHYFQKTAAERAVHKLSGVVGVINQIDVMPTVIASNVKQTIDAALNRNAEIEANKIQLQVEGAKVTVRGKVDSWHERDVILAAVRSIQAVREIEDHLEFT